MGDAPQNEPSDDSDSPPQNAGENDDGNSSNQDGSGEKKDKKSTCLWILSTLWGWCRAYPKFFGGCGLMAGVWFYLPSGPGNTDVAQVYQTSPKTVYKPVATLIKDDWGDDKFLEWSRNRKARGWSD